MIEDGTLFYHGSYVAIESVDLIKRLLPDRLDKQYCFLTEAAVNCLEVVEVKRYDI